MKLTPQDLELIRSTVSVASPERNAWLLDHIHAIAAERDELREAFDLELRDWVCTDTAVKAALKPFMDVEGDSYGVPGIQELVDNAAAKITAITAERDELRGWIEQACQTKHGASGMCCSLREQERQKAARWQSMAERLAGLLEETKGFVIYSTPIQWLEGRQWALAEFAALRGQP